jgi:uncharacterized protein
MFRRRNPPHFLLRLRGALWPSLGWARYFAYIRLKLSRLSGSPHSIALGFAAGVAVAPTPILGAHLIGAALLAVLLRGNVIASTLGCVLVGNPWTYTVLWPATLEIGRFMVPEALWPMGADPVNFVQLFKDMTEALVSANFALLVEKVLPAVGLMTIGSVPIGLVGAVIGYFLVRRAVERFKAARESRRQRRRLAYAALSAPRTSPSL